MFVLDLNNGSSSLEAKRFVRKGRENHGVLSHAEVLTPLTPCSRAHLIWCLAAVIAPRIISYLQVPPLRFSTSGFL